MRSGRRSNTLRGWVSGPGEIGEAVRADHARYRFPGRRRLPLAPDRPGLLEVTERASMFVVPSSDARLTRGYSSSLGIVDERQVHRKGEFYEFQKTSGGARTQALVISITTAGVRPPEHRPPGQRRWPAGFAGICHRFGQPAGMTNRSCLGGRRGPSTLNALGRPPLKATAKGSTSTNAIGREAVLSATAAWRRRSTSLANRTVTQRANDPIHRRRFAVGRTSIAEWPERAYRARMTRRARITALAALVAFIVTTAVVVSRLQTGSDSRRITIQGTEVLDERVMAVTYVPGNFLYVSSGRDDHRYWITYTDRKSLLTTSLPIPSGFLPAAELPLLPRAEDPTAGASPDTLKVYSTGLRIVGPSIDKSIAARINDSVITVSPSAFAKLAVGIDGGAVVSEDNINVQSADADTKSFTLGVGGTLNGSVHATLSFQIASGESVGNGFPIFVERFPIVLDAVFSGSNYVDVAVLLPSSEETVTVTTDGVQKSVRAPEPIAAMPALRVLVLEVPPSAEHVTLGFANHPDIGFAPSPLAESYE